jgi:hypothetical protein
MREAMRRLILVALMYFCSSHTAWASGGLMGSGQIQNMQSAYGGWLIFMTGTNANPDGCPTNIPLLIPSGPQETNYKELFAVFWSAQLTKTQVNIYVAGCHPAGYKLVYFLVTG